MATKFGFFWALALGSFHQKRGSFFVGQDFVNIQFKHYKTTLCIYQLPKSAIIFFQILILGSDDHSTASDEIQILRTEQYKSELTPKQANKNRIYFFVHCLWIPT